MLLENPGEIVPARTAQALWLRILRRFDHGLNAASTASHALGDSVGKILASWRLWLVGATGSSLPSLRSRTELARFPRSSPRQHRKRAVVGESLSLHSRFANGDWARLGCRASTQSESANRRAKAHGKHVGCPVISAVIRGQQVPRFSRIDPDSSCES